MHHPTSYIRRVSMFQWTQSKPRGKDECIFDHRLGGVGSQGRRANQQDCIVRGHLPLGNAMRRHGCQHCGWTRKLGLSGGVPVAGAREQRCDLDFGVVWTRVGRFVFVLVASWMVTGGGGVERWD